MRSRNVVVPLVVLSVVASISSAACSSSDDPEPASLEHATVEAGTLADASSADAKGASDASTGSTDAPSDTATGATFSGEATYYDADGTGSCGFKASPNDLLVAAMNKSQYAKSWCGQCVLVTGPKGTVKVRIVDLCPGCAHGDLDLSEQAFTSIASLSAGRVKISWHAVSCQ